MLWRREELCVGDRIVAQSVDAFELVRETDPQPNRTWWDRLRGHTPALVACFCTKCRFKDEFEAVIQCTCCGNLIFRTDPVWTPLLEQRLAGVREGWATTVPDRGAVVLCLRTSCCPSVAFMAGYWMGDHVASLFRSGSFAGEVLSGNHDVMVGNVGDLSSIKGYEFDKE